MGFFCIRKGLEHGSETTTGRHAEDDKFLGFKIWETFGELQCFMSVFTRLFKNYKILTNKTVYLEYASKQSEAGRVVVDETKQTMSF